MPENSPERSKALRRARSAARTALRIARFLRNDLPHALRESANLAALAGSSHHALRLFDKALRIADSQRARYEVAQTLAAKGNWGLRFNWPEAQELKAQAEEELSKLTNFD
jgi:hypothetical protein